MLLLYLEHPWMIEGGEASDRPIDSAVLSRMKQFRAMNKLKKLALKVGSFKFPNHVSYSFLYFKILEKKSSIYDLLHAPTPYH